MCYKFHGNSDKKQATSVLFDKIDNDYEYLWVAHEKLESVYSNIYQTMQHFLYSFFKQMKPLSIMN